MGDGGQRVLAATIGARAALMGLGLSAVFGFMHAAWSRPRSPELAGSLLLGSAAPAAILLPPTGALRFARLEHLPAPECRTPLVPFAARLDRETIALRIVPAG
jgi:hypothetical protein